MLRHYLIIISYLCEFGFIKFFLPWFLCFNDARKRRVKTSQEYIDVDIVVACDLVERMEAREAVGKVLLLH